MRRALLRFPAAAFVASFVAAVTAAAAHATEPVRPAREVLAAATSSAAAGKKTVFVGFHASWCGWCRKMERVLGLPGVKEAFDARFETVWLTVQERGPKKALDTPGAQELYERWAGAGDVGLPFYVFLDAAGKVVATSASGPDGKAAGNLGYPADAAEVERFLALVRKAAPGLSAGELSSLRGGFAPKAP